MIVIRSVSIHFQHILEMKATDFVKLSEQEEVAYAPYAEANKTQGAST